MSRNTRSTVSSDDTNNPFNDTISHRINVKSNGTTSDPNVSVVHGDYTSNVYEPSNIHPLETQSELINKQLINNSQYNTDKPWVVRVKRLLRNDVFWGISVLVVCIIVAVVIMLIYQSVRGTINLQQYQDPYHEQIIINIVGGVFAGCALIITSIQIYQHYKHYLHPPSQRRIIAILCLVPVYGIFGWLSTIFISVELYFQTLIDCYESYVVYSFLILLTKYLGGHHGVAQIFESKQQIQYLFPLNWCPGLTKGVRGSNNLVWYIKWCTLQYCWVGIICALITLITNVCGVYEDGVFTFSAAYVYVTIIVNCSQVVALYCLIWLYQICKNELRPFKPFYKFLAIKALVFFTFWQSVLMSGLAYIHILAPTTCNTNIDPTCNGNSTGFTITEEKVLLENVIICIEVFCFAVAHHYVFNVDDYINGDIIVIMNERTQQANITYQNNIISDDKYSSDDALTDNEDNNVLQHSIELTETSARHY